MRVLLIAALLMNTDGIAQEPKVKVEVPQAAPAVQAATPAETESPAITIPAGTHVPLFLTTPMRAKGMRKGDSVRAETAFPVTVGKQVAIPAGTYVEGVIDRVLKRGPTGYAGLQMHFTRIVFVNGYNVALGGASAEARRGDEETEAPGAFSGGNSGMTGMALGFQQPPMLNPPPRLGPNPGEVAGIGIGVAAAVTVTAILLGRRHAGDIVFDTGYPFEMVLENSLALDAERVADAVASANAM
jgi:hypothetical protein